MEVKRLGSSPAGAEAGAAMLFALSLPGAGSRLFVDLTNLLLLAFHPFQDSSLNSIFGGKTSR